MVLLSQVCKEHFHLTDQIKRPGARCSVLFTCEPPRFAILPGLVQSPKPLDPGNMKKLRKNTKSPTSGWPPENMKKIPKKYEKGPKITIFVFFRYFFRIFGGQSGVGNFFFFFVIFSYFWDPGVFGLCTSPGRIANLDLIVKWQTRLT